MEGRARKTARASTLEEERERERGWSDVLMNDGREGEKKVGGRKTDIETHTETENGWKRQSETIKRDEKESDKYTLIWVSFLPPLSLCTYV